MMNNYRSLLLAFGLAWCTLIGAEEPQLRDDVPNNYTVDRGDTLWDISSTFLKNPWMWPEIWHINAQIENPHLIYPGDVIRLVYMAGQPRLTLDSSGRIYKLSPEARVLSVGESIPTISLDKINSFLSRSRIVDDKALREAPYVLAGRDAHLLVGAGDKLYARGTFLDDALTVFGIYRRGETFVDPITREKLGVQALDIGSSRLLNIEGDIGTLEALRTREEIRVGDRLLRQQERTINSTFYPSSPDVEVDGLILAVEGGVSQVGKMDVVVLNRGVREGLAAGNVLAVFKRGATVRDRVSQGTVKLPDERAGLLMVFRVFEKVSLGLVLEAEKGLKVNDFVKQP
ncbi:MAG: LysM peptidoglycan-binding domain-containing protein [Cellvibrionaceae bacterium]|nr:LysM peptidoglycan-binding domain-containing protein [Cellvibrionaceae bacterium]